jgi:hypothetical protein
MTSPLAIRGLVGGLMTPPRCLSGLPAARRQSPFRRRIAPRGSAATVTDRAPAPLGLVLSPDRRASGSGLIFDWKSTLFR